MEDKFTSNLNKEEWNRCNARKESDYLYKRSAKDILRIKFLIVIRRLICKVQFYGLENIQNESCIFVANHSSHLDIVCIYEAIIRRFGYKKISDH